VLVIFVIRTRGNPLKSRPSRWLTLTSLMVVFAAMILPLTPMGPPLGLVAPPAEFFAILAVMVVLYLWIVELVKRWFYRQFVPAA
jgi:Mg2+-importing ATPase